MDHGVTPEDHYKYLRNLLIVRIALTAVIVIPAIFFFVKLLRTPGYRHDSTRRWVNYTTWGFGLWALLHIVLIIAWSFQIPTLKWEFGFDGAIYEVAYRIAIVFLNIQTFLSFWAHIAVFLALFYMAHALTLLRTGSLPDSSAFRKGRGFALGGSIFVMLLSFTSFCLYMSVSFTTYSRETRDGREMRRLIATIFTLTCQAILLVMAIGSVVYSAKSRNKARGTAVQQSGLMLVVCSSLFLVRQVWEMLEIFFGGRTLASFFMETFFVDIVFGSYLSFVILVLLYVVATKASYSMSKVQYRSKVSTENLDA